MSRFRLDLGDGNAATLRGLWDCWLAGRRRGCRYWFFLGFKVESRDVGAARQLDADFGFFFFGFAIVLGELFADFARPDPHHGVASGVVAHRAPEHFGADHPLPEVIDVPVERVADNQAEEVLGAPASGEDMARQDLFEVPTDQANLLWSEHTRLTERRWTGWRHSSLRPLLSSLL